jgi:hypothetical protein
MVLHEIDGVRAESWCEGGADGEVDEEEVEAEGVKGLKGTNMVVISEAILSLLRDLKHLLGGIRFKGTTAFLLIFPVLEVWAGSLKM